MKVTRIASANAVTPQVQGDMSMTAITCLTTSIFIQAPQGQAADGALHIVRIRDNWTAWPIGWANVFRPGARGQKLPEVTVPGATM